MHVFYFLFISVLLSSCTHNSILVLALDYNSHGLDWADGHCASRALQSPINIDRLLGEAEPALGKFSFQYPVLGRKKIPFFWDEESLIADVAAAQKFQGDAYVMLDDAVYDLEKIQFRAQSEHMFKGKHFPLEMQIVHKKRTAVVDEPPTPAVAPTAAAAALVPPPDTSNSEADEQNYRVIVSVMMDSGEPIDTEAGFIMSDNSMPDYHPQMQKFLEQLPFPMDDKGAKLSVGRDLNLAEFVANATFIQYYGSVTTPPCTEAVTWLVKQQPIIVAKEQIQDIANTLRALSNGDGNYRINMPIGPNRSMKLVAATPAASTTSDSNAESEKGNEFGVYQIMTPGPNPRTDNEYRSIQKIKMAKEAAEKTLEYVGSVKKRYLRAQKAFTDHVKQAIMQ